MYIVLVNGLVKAEGLTESKASFLVRMYEKNGCKDVCMIEV